MEGGAILLVSITNKYFLGLYLAPYSTNKPTKQVSGGGGSGKLRSVMMQPDHSKCFGISMGKPSGVEPPDNLAASVATSGLYLRTADKTGGIRMHQ